MTGKNFLSLIAGVFNWICVSGQAMDNTLAYKNIPSNKYFRINYENDFFAAFDRDYTQGILIEKVHPGLSKFLLMHLLWHPSHSSIK